MPSASDVRGVRRARPGSAAGPGKVSRVQTSTRRFRIAAAGIASLLTLTLAACGSSEATPTPTESATPTPTASETAEVTAEPIPVSSSIDPITVTGDPGAAPTVTIPAPFAIDQTRFRVLSSGQGPQLASDAIVEINYAGYNARTGELFDSSWAKGTPALLSLQQVVPGFATGLTGRHVGDRVLMVMPGSDGYDSAGGQPDAGIEVGDTLVFVVDVIAASLSTATGEAQTLPAGLPRATVQNGVPTVTIDTAATPPADLVVQQLIRGTQRAVGQNDYVMVHYRTWSWKTGQLIEDYYETPDAGAINDTIEAWRRGIVGQPIGSRVMLIAPPAYAYPDGNATPAIEAGDTLVYVVDILFSSGLA